ncbi:hypothetical protein BRARA_K01460 [Brassica rapa]|uniref:Factor of DNA methylation 1-5/IDN2 domain-containing protein n=1 Tax=Brassica campestris TaxID=3711 RepID=A0A397L3V6_BRACM|nr:hypothetical protein BRARA_K01460 [Brassica rapa]
MSDKEVICTDEVDPLNFENQLDLKEEELLSASCRLVKIFPHVISNYDGNDPKRIMGKLDMEMFVEAYRDKATEYDTQDMIRERASETHELWSNIVRAANLQLDPNADNAPFRPYRVESLEILKEELGLTLYRHIRKAFREVRVAAKYRVHFRPWNTREDKEANFDSLLTSLTPTWPLG